MASSGEPSGTEIPTDIARLPVGAALRTRREQLGWSMQEVAAWLRIRLPYLEALESGQVGKLPGGAYAMGFLRAYAGALGLDADDMVRRFRGETKDVARRPELSFPVPVPERGVPAGAIVLLGVVMVVAAYVGWYELGGRLTHQAHTVPPVPDALAPYEAGVRGGPSPQVAAVMPSPGQTPSPLPQAGAGGRAADAATQKPAASSPETAGVAADMPPPPATAPASATASPTTSAPPGATTSATGAAAPNATSAGAAAPVATATPGATPGATSIAAPATAQPGPAAASPAASGVAAVTLNAVATCWVQVRQVGGKVIYDHVLQAGEHWSVPADSGEVVLNTGNAGGLTVSADGVTSPVLGRVGGVRRGIPLTAAAVKDGSIAVTAGSGGAPPAAVASPVSAPSQAGPPATPSGPASGGDAGSSDAAPVPAHPVARPRPVPHRPTPAVPAGEDETDRLNRAQLRQPSPQL